MTISDILLPYQKTFLAAPQKRKLWISGRQLGKSLTIAAIMILKSLLHKNGLSICISTGARAAAEIIRKCANFAEAIKQLSNNKISYTQSFDSIKFSNGCRVISLPSSDDGSNLRGFTAQCVCIDEFNFIPHLEEQLNAIAPTLTRDPNAELIMTSTPAGKNGFGYKLYCDAKNSADWYVQETTIYDAVADGLQVDIENLKSLCPDPDVFKQEYCCEFLNEYGSMIDVDLLIFDEITTTKGPYFLGMDVGSTNDRTVFAILEKNTIEKKYKLIDLVVMHKASYQE